MKSLELTPTGPLSEKGKVKLKNMMNKREKRLNNLTENCKKNSTFEDSPDGFIKVTLPTLGIVTWAKDLEDAKVAITEAVKSFEITADRFGQGFENELDRAEIGL